MKQSIIRWSCFAFWRLLWDDKQSFFANRKNHLQHLFRFISLWWSVGDSEPRHAHKCRGCRLFAKARVGTNAKAFARGSKTQFSIKNKKDPVKDLFCFWWSVGDSEPNCGERGTLCVRRLCFCFRLRVAFSRRLDTAVLPVAKTENAVGSHKPYGPPKKRKGPLRAFSFFWWSVGDSNP